jgi:hypothetical protein
MKNKIKAGTALKVLCLEDVLMDAEIMRELITNSGFNLDMDITAAFEEFESFLRTHKYDVILSDFKLSGFDAFAALHLCNAICPDVPFICVSGSIGEDTAIELLKLGAVDYVLKDRLVRLPFSIKRALNEVKEKRDRNKTEELLRESEEKYRILSELSPEMIYLIDLNGCVTYLNQAGAAKFRVNPSELIGKHLTEIFPSDIASRNLSAVQLVINSKTPTYNDVEMKFPFDNVWVTSRLSPIFDKEYNVTSVLGLSIDITKRKMAELELLKLSRAVEFGPATVVITNKDGDIEYVNQKFCDLTGYSKEEAYGKNPRILSSGYHDKKFYEEFWNILLAGDNWSGELMNKKKNGEMYWESALISPLMNSNGDITNFVAVKEDITQKKMLIDELVQSKERAESANKLKDAFIANISHEIRTPLNGILGMSSLIKDLFQDNIKKEDEELFEGIEFSSNRIIRTVDMILNYSRLQVGEYRIKPIKIKISNICTSLTQEFNIAAKAKSLELTFLNNCGNTTVLVDENSITMVVSNLIDNAIKFTDLGFVSLILYKGIGNEIILEVKDSGIGIGEEYLDKIFEPYRQEQMGYGRAYEGIGLGLAIVKKVLQLNNCSINVASKKGEGTTFYINFGKGENLPENKSAAEPAAGILPAQEEMRQKVVLLVEDDLMNQVTISRFIENTYSVITTDSSDDAREILKKQKIDLILMDISIKGRLDGLGLTKELKKSKEFSHVPVIAITAHAFEEDKQKALKAGCDNYLAKPFTKESLLNMIAVYACK